MDLMDEKRDALNLSVQDAESAYQRLLDAIPDGVVIHSADGCMVLVNQQTEALFGYSRAELLGETMEVLMPERFRGRHQAHRASYIASPRVRPMGTGLDLYGLRKDGTEFPVEISLSPIGLGSRQLVISVIRDVTDRKQTERERAHFISAISHDLGQPLIVVNGTIRLLQRLLASGQVPTAEDLNEELESIAASTASMIAMVTELLDLARGEASRPLDLVYRSFDLVDLVKREARLQQRTTKHPIEVQSQEAELPFEGDRERLSRVVSNLLSNAVKYSPDGGEIRVSLTVKDEGERQWAVLSVADHGLGIPAADLPRIFERFHRAANVATTIAGTGIGLSGAKQTVEQHGGDIHIKSIEGSGTTVTVRLPLD
jgi:protein-histidine pros-kinase